MSSCHSRPLPLRQSFLGQARSHQTLLLLLSPPSLLAGMSSLLHECWHPISSPHCGEVCSAAPALSLVYNDAGSFVVLLLLRVTYFVVFQDQICQTVTLLNVLLRL